MIRASVTEVDTFLWWSTQEGATIQDLQNSLRRITPPTREMLAGRALHKALEFAPYSDAKHFDQSGFHFTMDTEMVLFLPTIRELKSSKIYQLPTGESVLLTGIVDALEGRVVYDHKTTARLDAERFHDQYQWRFYLDMFDADQFVWNVFEMHEAKDKVFHVTGLHKVKQYRYPGMETNLITTLTAFAEALKVATPERIAA